jgi:hypothetical protein
MAKGTMNPELVFIDFVILSIIIEHVTVSGQPPSFSKLYNRDSKASEVNEWLEKHEIDALRATPLVGVMSLQVSVDRLRDCGLLTASGSLNPTPKGEDALERIGKKWRKWPVRVEYDKDTQEINWFDALYAPKK